MNKLDYAIVRVCIASTLFAVIGAIFCGSSYASDEPQPGSRYKIVGSVYLMVAYDSLNNRQVSRETAHAYLHSALYVKKSHVAYQSKVPVGTTMTIIGSAPKVLPLPFYANRYFVRLDPAVLPIEIDIILELNRRLDGSLDGLNPGLFARSDEEVEAPSPQN